MATRASGGVSQIDWRASLRASIHRAMQLASAVVLGVGLVFLTLAMVTYTQTDPSGSTAASGETVGNWMGLPGAYVSEFAFRIFGLPVILLLPLLYAYARKLWLDANGEDEGPVAGKWWRTVAKLMGAMVLLAIFATLASGSYPAGLPATVGGLAGLLGSDAIRALAGLAGAGIAGWIIALAATICLVAGVWIAGRIFALDWSRLLTVPAMLRRAVPAAPSEEPLIRRRPENEPAPSVDPPVVAAAPARRPPTITDPSLPPRPAKARQTQQQDLFADVDLPTIELLEKPSTAAAPKLDKLALERNARLLENVLDDFNVKGEITAVRTGPVVTMYELEPAPGIKASRVIGLADDIARNMSAISARVCSIPGKTVMGIELPNADRQIVSFRELVACEDFAGHSGGLPIILGKDIAGEPIVADLAAMPHLLVAGTTGSGKSVGLNTILLSLLYRFTPAELRLILVDPKVLELKSYDDIPHLLSPVVTEPPKAIRALKWAIEEMERRYRMMSDVGARNINGFNDRVRAAKAKGQPLGRRVQTGFDPDTGEALEEEEQLDYEVLPLVVIIIDELADLMITVGKEIEPLIQRLTQKSRAAGIHLIAATQRPSVDVITGVIKSNMPTRISFHVMGRIDSRTILGEQGAEQLLGKGDMLYKPNAKPIERVHGPFVSDEEVERVAEHWRQQGTPDFVDSVTEEPSDGGFGFDDDLTASDDPAERKYREACQIVFESQKASASWLQRRMKVGYNTAAKWVERMEEDGLVGPANHVGKRDIYRDRDGNPL